MTSVKWNDKEVYGWKATVVGTLIVAWVMLGILFMILTWVVLLMLIPITLPIHILLRYLGRRGFFYEDEPGSFNYNIGPGAFKRA